MTWCTHIQVDNAGDGGIGGWQLTSIFPNYTCPNATCKTVYRMAVSV